MPIWPTSNAGLSYNQSIYDYLSSKADLEKLLGKNLEIKNTVTSKKEYNKIEKD